MRRFTEPAVENLTSIGLPGTVTTNITGDGVTDVTDDVDDVGVTDETPNRTDTGEATFSGDDIVDRFADPVPDFSRPAGAQAGGGTDPVLVAAAAALLVGLATAVGAVSDE
jgi:hypothetical protein